MLLVVTIILKLVNISFGYRLPFKSEQWCLLEGNNGANNFTSGAAESANVANAEQA